MREDVLQALSAGEAVAGEPGAIGDDRLRLMLVCAHPAIDPVIRPALVLQTVLGLDVKAMASAFLLSAETLNKRLVRAKAKIRAAGLRFARSPSASVDGLGPALLEQDPRTSTRRVVRERRPPAAFSGRWD